MAYYNPKHPSSAYQAGALVAVYAAIQRAAMYKEFERHAYEETCNLFMKAEG